MKTSKKNSKKTTHDTNDQLIKLFPDLKDIFEAAEKNDGYHYTTMGGVNLFQHPGRYSPDLTQTIKRDMISYAAVGAEEYGEGIKKGFEWALALNRLDLALRRMIDDRKDFRELIEFPYDELEKLADSMVSTKDSITEKGHALIKKWIERLIYMGDFAYALRTLDTIDQFEMEAEMEEFDNDGNKIGGLSKEDATLVRCLCTALKLLTHTLLRVSLETDSCRLIERMETIEIGIKAILEGKKDDLIRAIKNQEAAEEFADCD